MNFKGEDFSACVVNHNQAITLGLSGGRQRTSISACLTFLSTWFTLQFWDHLASFPRFPIAEERDYTIVWLGCWFVQQYSQLNQVGRRTWLSRSDHIAFYRAQVFGWLVFDSITLHLQQKTILMEDKNQISFTCSLRTWGYGLKKVGIGKIWLCLFLHRFHREMGDGRISPASGVTAVEAKLANLVQSNFISLLATFW